MRNIFLPAALTLICFVFSLPACKTQESAGPGVFSLKNGIKPGTLLSQAEADQVLGEASHVSDSLTSNEQGIATYRSTHTANATEPGTGELGNLYFMIEQYPDAEKASTNYNSIKQGNQGHEGFEVLTGLGDEAYFHTDYINFYFILVRKGDVMFRMKVNKVTGSSSVEKFKEVAVGMAEKV